MTLLTVVMPCRNGLPRLRRALAAARQALAGHQFELIVADGGSSDGTLELLRREELTLIEGPDTSLYDGLNRAIAAASGDYLVWLNADDVLLAGIGELVDLARSADADLATGECEVVAGAQAVWQSRNADRQMDIASILFAVPAINCRLFKTQVLRRAGPFRGELGLAADRQMLLRLAELAPRRVVLPRLVYRYESHAGSRTMGRSWSSYIAVHEANAALARRVGDNSSDRERQRIAAAFGALSSLALARAQLASGSVGDGVRTLSEGIRSRPDPRLWWAGLHLHRRYRAQGSGW